MTFEKTVKLKGAILTQENLTKLMENLKQYTSKHYMIYSAVAFLSSRSGHIYHPILS